MTQLEQKITDSVSTGIAGKYIKTAKLFGSYAYGKPTAKSDIDLLVTLKSGIGYFTLCAIESELEKKLKKKVDLVTEGALSRHIRKDVLKKAKTVYVEK